MVIAIGYIIMVGLLIAAQMLLWKRYEIGYDYEEPFGLGLSGPILLAAFWPVTLIPYLFYAVTKYYIDGRDDDAER